MSTFSSKCWYGRGGLERVEERALLGYSMSSKKILKKLLVIKTNKIDFVLMNFYMEQNKIYSV